MAVGDLAFYYAFIILYSYGDCFEPGGGGFLENICTGMLKVDFRMLTIFIPVYCKKTPDHYTSL